MNLFRSSLIILLLAPTLIFSQQLSSDFTVDMGAPYRVVDAKVKEYFHHEGEILSIKIKGDIYIQKFDANSLAFKSLSVVPEKSSLPVGFVHEEFIQNKDKVFQFYNVWDKSNKTEQIFVHEISFSNPKVENKRLLLKSKDRKLTNMFENNKIDVYTSFNQSKCLMVYRKTPLVKRDKLNYDEIGLFVMDENMNEVWSSEVKMPYTEAEMDNLGYTIDSKGNAMILARVKKDKDNPYLEILSYSKGSHEPRKTKIDADGKYFPHGISLKEGKNGSILCAGFYGEGRSANGVYLSIMDDKGRIKDEKYYDIPLEIINKYEKSRTRGKNERKEEKGKEQGIYELGLDDVVVNEDGSIVVLGEVFFVRVTTTYKPSTTTSYSSQTTTTYNYYYQEMFACKITADGKMAWMNKMPKNQYRSKSSSQLYFKTPPRNKSNKCDLSYKYLTNGKEHYFLFLDNVANLTLGEDEYPKKHMSGKGGFFTAYKVNDKTGDVSKLSLFDLKDVKGTSVYQFNTDRIVQKSDREIVLELYKKKKEDVLIKVTIDD